MGDSSTIEVMAHRESINAGDDFDAPHWHSVELPRVGTFADLIAHLWDIRYVPDTSRSDPDIWALRVRPHLGRSLLIAVMRAVRTEGGDDIGWEVDRNTPLSDPQFHTDGGYISVHLSSARNRNIRAALDYARRHDR
ncbi:hypothetical protein [Nocardia sp. NPDC051832]|uniref:hypothetical protein n=1 Tax=Nocardia sp. NPDC051832 TaxID=3155673 RepID=UPI003415B31E